MIILRRSALSHAHKRATAPAAATSFGRLSIAVSVHSNSTRDLQQAAKGGSDLLRPPLNRRERIERCVHSNKSMDLQQAANGGGGNAPQSLRVRFATIQWLP